jgi:nitroreductase
METLQAIRTRRSIRQYQAHPVPAALLDQLLQAAMQAPSAGNAQTWELVVVDDPAKLAAASTVHPGAAMLRAAPLGILVCGNPTREKMPGFWPQDCSAATQNLLLAAHDLGLGAVWIGLYPLEPMMARIREVLGLPSHIAPLAFVALGYPAETVPAEERFDHTRVHHNGW